ncbi:MAG: hypothetical protein NDI60_10310 [Elusimicrobiales bacterium]|nr:hypothetical protein [Elusimicrobiales bacterium]
MLIVLEILMYLQVPLVWYLFRRYGGRDVSGSMLAGLLIGVFNEFATEPLWDYHLRLTFYKDAPVAILLCWAVMFTAVVNISSWLYRRTLKLPAVDPGDKRILLFDVAAAVIIAFPMETFCLKLGIWTYRLDKLNWDWGTIPLLGMPWEALAGYCLFMLIGPSFVRAWQEQFSFMKTGDAR